MIERIGRRIGLKPRELMNALWMGAVLVAITGSYTLVKTARDSLFLSQLPAGWLPYVFVMVGVVTLAVSWAFGQITQRLSPLRSLIGTALVSALGLAAFASSFQFSRTVVPIGFYVFVNAYGLILTSQFWSLTNSVSDPSEAKRIFGIIGGGGILGGLLGGMAAAALGPRVPLEWLTFGAAGLLILMVPALLYAMRRGRVSDPRTGADRDPALRRGRRSG